MRFARGTQNRAIAGLLALVGALVLLGCEDISFGEVGSYSVRVHNGGPQAVSVIIQLPDKTAQRKLAPGALADAVGYEKGPYTVTIILDTDARATYVAGLTQLRDRLRTAQQTATTDELRTILSQLPLVESELKKLQGTGLPACTKSLTDQKRNAIVGLVYNQPVAGNPGVWIPSCG
ncbi:MAG: hypothetical protein QOH61_2395 [Chloroflexota bacterium]|jgi:hypothetical protein|nr:hypothetical protein [Chloroflexota bacterium]